MKLIIYFAAFLACTSAATIPQLTSDLAEFNSLIPVDRVAQLAEQYMISDSQFREILQYFQTDEFKAYWVKAINAPEFQAIVEYLASSGYDLVELVNYMASALNYPRYSGVVPEITQSRTVMSFFEAMLNALPKEEMRDFIKEKVQTSPAFQYFYERITSPAFRKLIGNFYGNPDLQGFWQALADRGYYPLEILTLWTKFLGIN